MATVHKLLYSSTHEFYAELQVRADNAEAHRHRRFLAVLTLQRMARGYLIRKHVAWLSHNALIIQCAFRCHLARKAFRRALKEAVRKKYFRYYARCATMIEALYRGHVSRRMKFCYRSYRVWLRTVTERGERRAAEAAEFGLRSRADDLRILEEEARQWLAYVVFKLHHLLRTQNCAGVYSDIATKELTEFEQLLFSIKYTQYMKRLRRKYEEFVRQYKPKFNNKKVFPIIGDGADYWYLSLPEMYELTVQPKQKEDTRHLATHHGKIHKQPFLWKRVCKPLHLEGRGPYTPPRSCICVAPPTPSPTPCVGHTNYVLEAKKDPRFHLYVKYYRPRPEVLDYVDYHVNILLKRRCSIKNMNVE